MPRTNFSCSTENPYHISSRSNNREFFDLPLQVVWEIKASYLYLVAHAMNVRIHSFVLMDNHFHLLASFPDGNLSSAMLYFMRESSKTIGKEAKRMNHIYGGRVFRSCTTTYNHYMNVYKYVYRNPVEAGLSDSVESYPYSTLNGLVGHRALDVPLADDPLLFESGFEETMSWLNTPIGKVDLIDIRNGLRNPNFKLRKVGRHSHPLESSRC